MPIKKHPTLHFIEVGSTLSFGELHGWSKDEAWSGSANEWMYAIKGFPGAVISWSEESACEAAEEDLFLRDTDYLKILEQELRSAGDIDCLLAIAELKGYWRGKSTAEMRAREILTPALKALNLVAR